MSMVGFFTFAVIRLVRVEMLSGFVYNNVSVVGNCFAITEGWIYEKKAVSCYIAACLWRVFKLSFLSIFFRIRHKKFYQRLKAKL